MLKLATQTIASNLYLQTLYNVQDFLNLPKEKKDYIVLITFNYAGAGCGTRPTSYGAS